MQSQRASFDYSLLAFAIGGLLVCFFLPLWLIDWYDAGQVHVAESHSSEVTVGIGVILRATARRLIRSGARNVLRTTTGAFTRATFRTITRRVVRAFSRAAIGATSKTTAHGMARDESTDREASSINSLLGVAIGFVGLALSFWGVLFVAGQELTQAVIGSYGLSTATACLLAAIPIVVYVAVSLLAARIARVRLACSTEVDGLLIQAYFTGAGSFLPMTTDLHYLEGDRKQKSLVALASLLAVYALHLLTLWFSALADSPPSEFLAAMFLVYSFVYAFPIAPLEGHLVWSYSKAAWICLFVPILASFIFSFPPNLSPLF